MKNEFCTYEQALALKELGFDEDCFGHYQQEWHDDGMTELDPSLQMIVSKQHQHAYQLCTSPTYSQAFRWSREKYGFDYSIYRPFTKIKQYCWNITNREIGFEYPDKMIGEYAKTYEEAESACLDKLIEIVQQSNL